MRVFPRCHIVRDAKSNIRIRTLLPTYHNLNKRAESNCIRAKYQIRTDGFTVLRTVPFDHSGNLAFKKKSPDSALSKPD